ncbi:CEP1 [Symbiodinium natans]|uniref:CEP1 protein n=1 Tax=Symbiodinium natans TaxID=878477 RepID=A0A812PXS6_9DINO|nr:CEP1 [Symbiodinium natans]
MAARADPFLTDVEVPDYKATASLVDAARREHMVSQEVAVLIFAPWSCYVALVIAFALPPQGWLWSLLAGIFWVAALLVARQAYERHLRGGSPVYKLLALMVLLSCVAGPLVGMHIEQRKMASYWMHKKGVTYRDVVPTKPADAYQDASILDFSAGTRLDLQRTLGVRSPGSGMTYCVAPVIDTSSPSKHVNYFAADVNCCEPRRSFLCGDTAKADARTGVVLPAKSSEHAAERWKHFFKAAQQAAEVYGWELPERPIFVRWFEDAEGVQSELLHQGLVETFVQCFAGLCAAVIVAMLLVCSGGTGHFSLVSWTVATCCNGDLPRPMPSLGPSALQGSQKNSGKRMVYFLRGITDFTVTRGLSHLLALQVTKYPQSGDVVACGLPSVRCVRFDLLVMLFRLMAVAVGGVEPRNFALLTRCGFVSRVL